jgi:hypothetical protein
MTIRIGTGGGHGCPADDRPPSLAPGVLSEIGLVDRYAHIDSDRCLCRLNGLGVSAVEASANDTASRRLTRHDRSSHDRAERLPASLERDPAPAGRRPRAHRP